MLSSTARRLTASSGALVRHGPALTRGAATTGGSVAVPTGEDGTRGVGGVHVPAEQRSGVSASHRRGTGGRASFSGNVCTVFGTTGLTGPFVVSRLARDGTQIILPYRCDPYYIRTMKQQGDLGQILFFPFDLMDENSIRKVVKYSNVVVNLIGRDFETRAYPFDAVNVDGAGRLARISREMGVERFIHLSALNATKQPTPHFIPGGSQFLRSKALGEEAVREEFPNATIIRPAQMYEFNDRLFRFTVKWTRRTPTLKHYMWNFGQETFKMPIWVGDVAMGIQRIVQDPTLDGHTYEFVGPYSYKWHDLAKWMWLVYNQAQLGGFHQGFRRGVTPYDQFMTNYNYFVKLMWKKQSIAPACDWEYLEKTECTSDELTGCPTLSDVGLKELHIIEYKLHRIIKMLGADYWHLIPNQDRPEVPRPTRYPPRYTEATLRRQAPVVTGTASRPFREQPLFA